MRWSTEEFFLLGLAVTFAGCVLIARRTRNHATRSVTILASIVLGSLLTLGIALYVHVFLWPPFELSLARRGWLEDRRFDAELWRRGTEGQLVERSRAAMVDHLLASRDGLVGMSRVDLEALLGKPEFDPSWAPGDLRGPCCNYWVGAPIDGDDRFGGSLRMAVCFDAEARVVAPVVLWTVQS